MHLTNAEDDEEKLKMSRREYVMHVLQEPVGFGQNGVIHAERHVAERSVVWIVRVYERIPTKVIC